MSYFLVISVHKTNKILFIKHTYIYTLFVVKVIYKNVTY